MKMTSPETTTRTTTLDPDFFNTKSGFKSVFKNPHSWELRRGN